MIARAALGLIGMFAFAPPAAAAAPFGELPFRSAAGAATCLAPTGTPGELARWTWRGAELLQASPTGLTPTGTIPLGSTGTCPEVEAHAGGGGVVAALGERGLRVAVRDPGGSFGAPVTLTRAVGWFAAAASPRGDVVVAWTEPSSRSRSDLRVARRAPGGAFGPPETLVTDRPLYDTLEVAVTGAGEAFVVSVDRSGYQLAEARAGKPFAAARRIGGTASEDIALKAEAGGRVLVALAGSEGIAVHERAPGGAFVAHPFLAVASPTNLALALRPDGGAVIAWQNGRRDAVRVSIRDGAGPFGPRIRVAGPEGDQMYGPGFGARAPLTDGPPVENYPLRVELGADGRALLAWSTELEGGRLATVTSAGAVERQAFGGPLREAFGATPLLLGGGARAVAWTDNRTVLAGPPYAGRLHLAVEGAADAITTSPPALHIGAPRDRTLRPSQQLALPVRCAAACDLRAQVGGSVQSISLTRAGTAWMRFDPVQRAIAPRRPGRVPVRITWSAPGARDLRSRTASVRLRRLPATPLPRILDVRARRLGGGVVEVRWTTDRATADASFGVFGTRRPSLDEPGGPVPVAVARGGPRRRSFRVRLEDARSARYVHVDVARPPDDRGRTVRARIAQ